MVNLGQQSRLEFVANHKSFSHSISWLHLLQFKELENAELGFTKLTESCQIPLHTNFW